MLLRVSIVLLPILPALSSTPASWLVVLIFAIQGTVMWVRYSRAECISVFRLYKRFRSQPLEDTR